ncbi:MAG: 16S rRNA (adenine(1518)-N(6)/adenine(1519)-N(6))-dimethyltransferase RsmA [Deltaproteobacteria bacterium]|nr:16S rRNA (adenine(1518)-N(6)/adenine(1519)-N(6))-dimethyltransferase RsmA [Deltaproteobacteria bacterium]
MSPRPSKSLGQNFLIDSNIARKIVAFAECNDGDVVVEIGAGRGALTPTLAGSCKKLFAVEIDARLKASLQEATIGLQNVEILMADARKISYDTFKSEAPLKIVGNIPYYASTDILFNILDQRHLVSSVTFMLQKELALRLCAQPCCKEYGIPTVILGMFANVVKGFNVSPFCFYPQPHVTSTVIRIDFLQESKFPLDNIDLLTAVVHGLFAQRRKSVLNNLKNFFEGNTTMAREILTKANIAPLARAEHLSLCDFATIANLVNGSGWKTEAQKILDARS